MANKNGAGASVYAASKAGLVGTLIISLFFYATEKPKLLYIPKTIRSLHVLAAFTRALATEYSPRSIRVNALLPGWIASPMWDRKSIPILPH
jgi:3-oxoacyl-[acyl-carrier protein] reductase